MPEWIIELSASEDVLETLLRLPRQADWRVERHERRGVVIRGERFDREPDYDKVTELSKREVELLDLALRRKKPTSKRVKWNGVVEIIDKEGTSFTGSTCQQRLRRQLL